MRLLAEAAAKRVEREHNSRAWLAWHIAAMQRMKRIPDLKKLTVRDTTRPRQTWRQQLEIMAQWASKRNEWLARQEKMNGR